MGLVPPFPEPYFFLLKPGPDMVQMSGKVVSWISRLYMLFLPES